MYYKKKKYSKYKKGGVNKRNIVPVKGKNYYIDSKGQKQFWLTKRVPKKLFNVLRLQFNFVHKKWIVDRKKEAYYPFLFKNKKYLKRCIFFLFLKKCRKNIFANFSDILGNVVYKASSGFFHKRSLRKTYFATGFLLKKMHNSLVIKKLFLNDKKKKKRKTFFFLNIVDGNYQRGFRKNLKDFIKKKSSNFYKITELKCKAHNGVRKSKKRRK
jgi:hypothetical protein